MFKQVIYEDFTDAPYEIAKDVYNFLGLSPPPLLKRYLQAATHKTGLQAATHKTGPKRKQKDRRFMTPKQKLQIQKQCKEFYQKVQAPKWQHAEDKTHVQLED